MSRDNDNESTIEHHKGGAAAPDHSRLHSEAVEGLTHRRERHTHAEPREESLRELASPSAFSQHGYWAKQENSYYQQGQILVLQGDTLNSIAKKVLEMRGVSTAGPDAILDEADRIRQLNMYNPVHTYLQHSHRVEVGMILNISEPRIGPDIHTAWQPWKDAKPGQVTFVQHGERAVALPGSKVVVEPGGAAVISAGAAGFGYQKSYVEALPGSVTVAGGNVQEASGARVVKVGPDATVTELPPDAQRYPQLFPR